MTGFGANWNHSKRFGETAINKTANIPPLRLLIKDHKPIKPGQLPKTRPVVASQSSMNLHLNNILSEILEPLANNCGVVDVVSLEEMLAEVDSVNRYLLEARKDCDSKLKKDKESLLLIGADMISLYPNLRKEQTAAIVAEKLIESNLEISGLDWKDLSRYVFLYTSDKQQMRFRVRLYTPRSEKKGE